MNSLARTLAFLVTACLMAAPALGLSTYPGWVGTNVTYSNVQENSTFGDPEPLFGAPSGFGNQLLFFPGNFTAEASGDEGFDQTGSQLQLTIEANSPTDIIEELLITEFGDNVLVGTGTAATGSYVTMAGFITVQETTAGPIAPAVIGFTGTFDPGSVFSLPGDAGTTLWSGEVQVDISQQLFDLYGITEEATKLMLSFDNELYAYSEDGTSAKIQKKVVSGPSVIIDVIPEPGTFALVAGGLVGLALRGRRRS